MLNWRASVSVRFPQFGQARFASRKQRRHLVRRLALGVDPKLLLDQVVGPEARLLQVLQSTSGIVEIDDVPGCLPDPRVHQDAGVEPDHIPATLDERPPPELLDIVLQLDAERSVVPGIRQTRRRYRNPGKTKPRRLESATIFSMVARTRRNRSVGIETPRV